MSEAIHKAFSDLCFLSRHNHEGNSLSHSICRPVRSRAHTPAPIPNTHTTAKQAILTFQSQEALHTLSQTHPATHMAKNRLFTKQHLEALQE